MTTAPRVVTRIDQTLKPVAPVPPSTPIKMAPTTTPAMPIGVVMKRSSGSSPGRGPSPGARRSGRALDPALR
jgi:hypothetical protein